MRPTNRGGRSGSWTTHRRLVGAFCRAAWRPRAFRPSGFRSGRFRCWRRARRWCRSRTFPKPFPTPAADRRTLDIRTIDGPFTPARPVLHHAALRPSRRRSRGVPPEGVRAGRPAAGAVARRPAEDGGQELVAGFECSGNRRPLQGASSNGRWTGVPLRTVLDRAGVKARGARVRVLRRRPGRGGSGVPHAEVQGRAAVRPQPDAREGDVGASRSWRTRSNGEPLTKHQGAPLRLIVPGWYGVANVKWLSADSPAGRGVPGQVPGALVPHAPRRDDRRRAEVDRARRHAHAAQVVHRARVRRRAARHKVLGVVLNDGTPLRSVEVKVDDGPWQAATLDPSTRERYAGSCSPTPGTAPRRASTRWCRASPTSTGRCSRRTKELENKKTFLEDNSQHPRKVRIA